MYVPSFCECSEHCQQTTVIDDLALQRFTPLQSMLISSVNLHIITCPPKAINALEYSDMKVIVNDKKGVGKVIWRRDWQLTPVFLPGDFHRQRSLVGYSPRRREELDMTEQLKHTESSGCDYHYSLYSDQSEESYEIFHPIDLDAF
ncbi:hypothetical protein MG293_001682 [Ovis ammon polii]|uniref:Uncharacterized protein n=1 Tax=Ovis ammon polii TaxID=230172 RepID=A0AAD4UQJ9_OVIAM|nr:hypothetical protein MG293_001682 [Ovis ammon polii]